MSKTAVRVVAAAALLVVAAPLGAFAYFHFIQKPPEKLHLSPPAPSGPAAGSGSGSGAGDVSGTWRPTSASRVGYRVSEVAFGQKGEAVGRTSEVSGTMVVQGSTVSSVDLSVDMASVASDESRRDNQFRGRIMDVSSFPTARFQLTKPIELPSTTGPVTVSASGSLTLRGTTKPVTVKLQAQRQGADIAVNGTVPIAFADWGIPNPSFGPISTEDHGVLELLVVFTRP